MERMSDKHSPRVDETLAHEVESLTTGAPVESRSREERVKEDPAVDGLPTNPAARPELEEDRALDARAELARHLAGAHWPARAPELVAVAVADHAPDEVVDALRRLPADTEYLNVQAVWLDLGGGTATGAR
jgi:hypothetical protein